MDWSITYISITYFLPIWRYMGLQRLRWISCAVLSVIRFLVISGLHRPDQRERFGLRDDEQDRASVHDRRQTRHHHQHLLRQRGHFRPQRRTLLRHKGLCHVFLASSARRIQEQGHHRSGQYCRLRPRSLLSPGLFLFPPPSHHGVLADFSSHSSSTVCHAGLGAHKNGPNEVQGELFVRDAGRLRAAGLGASGPPQCHLRSLEACHPCKHRRSKDPINKMLKFKTFALLDEEEEADDLSPVTPVNRDWHGLIRDLRLTCCRTSSLSRNSAASFHSLMLSVCSWFLTVMIWYLFGFSLGPRLVEVGRVVCHRLTDCTRWQPYFGTNFQHMQFFTSEADRDDRHCKSERKRCVFWFVQVKLFVYGFPGREVDDGVRATLRFLSEVDFFPFFRSWFKRSEEGFDPHREHRKIIQPQVD